MKSTIFQCITAIICVVAISLSLSSGLGKVAEAKIEGSKSAATAAGADDALAAEMDDFFGDDMGIGDDSAAAGDASTDATAGDAATDAAGDTATDAAGNTATGGEAAAPGNAAGNAAATSSAPKSAADITAYYNDAINKVISSKAGFKKTRKTIMNKLDGGAILKIQLVADMVNQFLGVGETQWDNEKGKQENLSKASLTASDVKSATCVDKNGIYTITLALKDGSSQASASGNSDTSPLGRSGLYAGKGDKIAFDYKNSENFYTAINNVENTSTGNATEQVKDAKIVITVDSKTGKIATFAASWNWSVKLEPVKYRIVTIDQATGDASTMVKITDFKW